MFLNRKCLLFLMVFVLSLMKASAQTTRIKGVVRDAKTLEALEGASMALSSGGGMQTDSVGHYNLKLKSGTFSLGVSLLGYVSQRAEFVTSTDTSIEWNVWLVANQINLEQLVVTAGKFEQKLSEVTVSMEVIKPRLAEISANTSVEQTLEQVPGVNIIDGQANIRGGSGFSYGAGSRVMMLVDDLPLLSADAGDIKWDFIPIENISQVEVIKGASSALFGSGALGGVINFRTAYPTEKPVTKVRFISGLYDAPENISYKYWNKSPILINASVLHSRRLGNWDLTASAVFFNDQSYRQGEHLQYGRTTGNIRYRFPKNQGLQAGVNYNIYLSDAGTFVIWKDGNNPLIPADNTISNGRNHRFSIDPYVTYADQKGNKHSLRTRLFKTINQITNDASKNSKSDLYYFDYQYHKTIDAKEKGRLNLTGGITNTYSGITSDSLYGNKTANNTAIYAQADYKYKKWNFSLGGRLERNRVDTLALRIFPVFRGGFNYEAGTSTFLRGSMGQGYRVPSIAELFANTNAGQIKVFPNPNLIPEQGWSAELGIKQGFAVADWKGFADVAIFRTEYRNMIEFIFDYYGPVPYPPNFFSYFGFSARNFTRARISGAEATLAGEGKIGEVSVFVLGGYTFLTPLNLDSLKPKIEGNQYLKYRYRHTAKFNVDARYKRIEAGGSLRYNSFMINVDPAFEVLLPGVKDFRTANKNGDVLLDLRASYNFDAHSKLSFVVKNVLNRFYMYVPANIGAMRTFNVQYFLSF